MRIVDIAPTPTSLPKTFRLGDLLVAGGVITPQQLEEALTYQRTKGGRLGVCLIKLGYLTEDVLHSVLTRQFGVALADLSHSEVDPEVVKLLPRELAVRYQVIPVKRTGNVLSVALNDPNDVVVLDELRFRTGYKVIQPLLARESQIREAIDKYYGTLKEVEIENLLGDIPHEEGDSENLQVIAEEEMDFDPEALKQQSEEAPIIRLVNFILVDSLRSGSSDIHIEPFEREMRVRFRIDGVLKTVMNPPVKLKDPMVSRIKIMAKLNISEK